MCTQCMNSASTNYSVNLNTLQCTSSCNGISMVIGGYGYCRSTSNLGIYINSNSLSEIELGTIDYPYKTID